MKPGMTEVQLKRKLIESSEQVYTLADSNELVRKNGGDYGLILSKKISGKEFGKF